MSEKNSKKMTRTDFMVEVLEKTLARFEKDEKVVDGMRKEMAELGERVKQLEKGEEATKIILYRMREGLKIEKEEEVQ